MKNVSLNNLIHFFYYFLVLICIAFLLKFITLGLQFMQTSTPPTATEMLVSAP